MDCVFQGEQGECGAPGKKGEKVGFYFIISYIYIFLNIFLIYNDVCCGHCCYDQVLYVNAVIVY